VIKNSGTNDKFTEIFGKFVEDTAKEMEGYKKRMDDNYKLFADAVDYFQCDKNDDMSKKSPEFFKFFVEFYQ